MIEFFVSVLLIGMACSFVLTLAGKWGIVEWLQMHGTELISKAANCCFCLSWWTNLLVCCAIAFTTKDYTFLFVPFFSTMITRHIL